MHTGYHLKRVVLNILLVEESKSQTYLFLPRSSVENVQSLRISLHPILLQNVIIRELT